MKLNKHMGTYRAEWRDIEGYEGIYQVSNLGQVRSLNYRRMDKVKILKLIKDKENYLLTHLSNNGERKTYKVHRLVAKTFIPNPNSKPQVDHIDTNSSNNKVFNLQWVTGKENSNNPLTIKHTRKASREKWKNEDYIEKTNGNRLRGKNHPRAKAVWCRELRKSWNTIQECSKELKLNRTHISDVCRGIRKTCGGYTFVFI